MLTLKCVMFASCLKMNHQTWRKVCVVASRRVVKDILALTCRIRSLPVVVLTIIVTIEWVEEAEEEVKDWVVT